MQDIWLSLNTDKPFIVPFRRTIIVSQYHTRKWCQGRGEYSVPEIIIHERESNQEPLQSEALTTSPRLSLFCTVFFFLNPKRIVILHHFMLHVTTK